MTTKDTNLDFSLSKPPLVCVVARVQFTPIAKIKNYVELLQDELRLKGFRYLEERQANTIQIGHNAQAGANVSFKEVKQWVVADQTRNISIRIDENSFSILFGKYTSFNDARELYQTLLTSIEKNMKGIFYNQLKLRYINHISHSVKEGPNKLVQPCVLGLPNLNELKRLASVSETSYQTSSGGHLVVRCSSMPNGLTMPRDLLPLEFNTELPSHSKTPFILLENLHAINFKEKEFSAKTCLEEFEGMRADIHQAFKQTTTEEAKKLWE